MKPTQTIVAVTPCEYPDTDLLFSIFKTSAFPTLHLGNDIKKAQSALDLIISRTSILFGVCFGPEIAITDINLPDQVSVVICDVSTDISGLKGKQVYIQIKEVQDLNEIDANEVSGVIVKGNEGAGQVSAESSFVLFQKVIKNTKIPVWVQGGVGMHTAPALIMAGAKGVVLDSQLTLFPECNLPKQTKETIQKIDGTETQVIDGYRLLIRPNSPKLPEKKSFTDVIPFLNSQEIDKGLLPLGQDVSFSKDWVAKYKNIKKLFFAINEAIYAHIRQAKALKPIQPNNAFAKEFNLKYPIVQGPMTRVSDVPEFANAVAKSGGLPFIALSLTKGKKALNMIEQTKALAGKKTWGVGILGFAPPELRDEQMSYIKAAKPPVVLIAGGRPSQAKPLEAIGIKTFLHVPSTGLLDMFIKEGATGFVFEGRECGGHVGPLSSFVLWERQIERLLQEDTIEKFNILFAGGIHDDVSAAMIATMAAPLAAKGAKIGVLMGTSYLFTKEAVTTGAILKQFQDQAIKHSDTVLLETAPGHETRCLKTPFADFFEEEKKRYTKEGLGKKEIWAKLETLNVGRLRMASKGIERQEDKLVKIKATNRLSDGMYMIGEVAALRSKVVTMEELHQHVALGNTAVIQEAISPKYPTSNSKPLDIAIVGMSCIYPGSKNIDEYWKNILLGKDLVTEVPDERWNKELYYDANSTNGDKTPSKWGGFIPPIDFDPMEFGIPPQSLAAIEPTQLLSLLVAKRALKDAGYLNAEDKENVSVIFGAEGGNDLATAYGFRCLYPQLFGEIPKELDDALPKLTEDSFPGVLANVISGRITNRLDLGGRNYTVDAACASSLTAVDLACQELTLGKSDMVLAGGVDLHNGINDYLMFSSTHALSRKGRCKTFDKDADGITLGEGVAVVVLKRLEDAKLDGDKIYAVVKGVGGSSDGKSLGLTAPRRSGQLKALERAYQQAGISPADVGLIEAHGTGTVVGDKTEISALTDLMNQAGATVNQTHLGSVKTQIGHTKCAAGLAGFIKTALAIHHGIKPPTLQLENPNPFYKATTSPFAFNTKAGLWNTDKRVAGVSAFGFGGTNFHAILESDTTNKEIKNTLQEWPSELLVFKGNTFENALETVTKVQKVLEQDANVPLKDIAYTLAMTARDEAIQLSIIAEDSNELLQKITKVLAGDISEGVYKTEEQQGKVALLFPGQGSQRVNMARDLFVAFPEMRKQLKEYPELERILFPSEVFDTESKASQQEAIKNTTNAQPLLGIVDYVIAKFLKKLGLEADMLAGHSYGELPALCFSEVFEEENLVPLSIKRAQSILKAVETEAGIMMAASTTKEVLLPLLENHTGVHIANLNSPKQIVLAGKEKDVLAFAAVLKSEKISSKVIPTACAFHSPLVANSKNNFAELLEKYTFREAQIPVWSNTTAALYPVAAAEIKERLTNHLVNPVNFTDQINNMYQEGARVFVEVGPGKVLTSLVKSILGKEKQKVLITTEDKAVQGVNQLLKAIAQYVATGRNLSISTLFEGRNTVEIDLEHPEKYAKSKTLCYVNGQYAKPVYMKMPSHGAKPILKPLQLATAAKAMPTIPAQATERLIENYLDNVKNMVHAQKDVILGYLGQNVVPTHTVTSAIEVPILNTNLAIEQPIIPVVNAPTSQILDSKSTKEMLLNIVSDKTGYPKDMLGLDMDLEADLSIDSIKRMEIIGVLKESLGTLQSEEKSEEALVEELAAIKTLRGLIAWVDNHAVTKETAPVVINIKQSVSANVAIDIQAILVTIVSDKTGYPKEMLGLDMDLEADLSIDSIKRLEIIGDLKAQLGGFGTTNKSEEELVEELTALKTLRSLVSWLEERTGKKQEIVETTTTVIETPIQEQKTVWTTKKIQSILVNIVSDKTGYPPEMLGMDMDLEADLSIDSIKRMEVIGELRTQLGGFDTTSQPEETIVEELAALKTLKALVDWIANTLGSTSEKPKKVRTINTSNGIPTKKGDDEKLVRWSFKLTTQQKSDDTLHQNELYQKRFAVTNDNGELSKQIKKQLENNGALVDIVDTESELSEYDGLILLDLFSSPKRPKIIDFVSFIKKLDPKRARWVYAISDLKGHIKASNDLSILRNFQGYSGFLKSLDKEWTEATCRTINLETISSPNVTASIIQDELLIKDNQIEVFYKEGERQIFEMIPTQLTNGITSEVQLDKKSVILVLGGAQGITSEMMIRLSSEYPCNFVLVGRSIDPRNFDEDQFTNLKTTDEIKKELIALKVFKTPSEIENETKKIFKRNQILNTIKSLEKNGASVDYQSIDITNESRLSGLIDHIMISYGRIDGVVHGAGLLEDKLFQNKTTASFERVFATKVNPIRILAEKLPENVQFVILFSSVASVFGNKGQTDYAAANSVLDEYAWELKEKLKGKVISINWGPWKGAGMVSATLENEYKRRGIALIPLKEGMETFINEIKYGNDSQVLIMAE